VWRHIAQSLQGPSHLADGTCCQDANRVCILGDAATSSLVACVADGAGSAKFSDVGSRIACDAIVDNATSYLERNATFDGFTRDEAIRWVDDAHARIRSEAQNRDCSPREMATTLCVVITSPDSSKFFQIGDGAIVIRRGRVYGVVFWPQSGEYANSTNFVTSDDYRDRLDFMTIANGCSDVALLTDGLERLALSFNQQTPHTPFFEPLFKALRTTDDLAGLSEGLRTFLGSQSVQNRSDDDKTLILATRRHADDVA
jgi:hypothetical protein